MSLREWTIRRAPPGFHTFSGTVLTFGGYPSKPLGSVLVIAAFVVALIPVRSFLGIEQRSLIDSLRLRLNSTGM